jgi:hypothetical protein
VTEPTGGAQQLPGPGQLGVTAHGLRYPAGTDPVYNVPAYLQNLATDIDTRVSKAGGSTTRVFATWVGLLTFARSPVYQTVPLPTIRLLRGAIVTRQTWGGGSAAAVLLYVYPNWEKDPWDQTYWNKLLIGAGDPAKLIDAGGGHRYADYFIGAAGVSVLAWGDPNPPP